MLLFNKFRSGMGFLAAVVFYVIAFLPQVLAQSVAPAVEFNPKSYTARQVDDSLDVDGKLDENWDQAQWTDSFVNIKGENLPRPRFDTRVKMLWDENYFYIAAKLEEPHLWATLTERDAVIFHENNFEVFIDPNGDTHNYYELEVNALGTYWDLMLTKPYRDGGRAIDAWDMRDLKVGIGLDGTLNNPADIDSGWTVELALPWEALEEAAAGGHPPEPGEQWRVNFSRVQWKTQAKGEKYIKESNTEDNWVWSAQGLINMHYPEMWGYVHFVDNTPDDTQLAKDSPGMQPKEQIKWYLRRLYYRQHDHRKNEKFTYKFEELDEIELQRQMQDQIDFEQWSEPKIHATNHTFEISVEHLETGRRWYIREDGRVWSE